MNARDAIKLSIDGGKMITAGYLGDLSDQDMLQRPHPECNHIKWQVGHLISAEHQMISGVCPGSMPELPDGFADRYTKETSASDDATAFDSKEDLLRLFEEQRAGTLQALAGLSDDDLDARAPEEMQAYAPTVGDVFSLQGGHWVMHAGQWAVIRRQLGRPPLF
ncbi:MAG: DinB family protein [Planctomycetota bacterium]|nr:DinB family protein [Planctomycetota bacterium]MDA1164088.1 DinB family protein [Planctomycetota bacterium]